MSVLPNASNELAPKHILFDLDGTLVRGDSFTLFCLYMLRRRPSRGVPLALLLAVGLLGACHPTTRRWCTAAAIWLLTVGLDDANLAELRADFVRKRFTGPRHIVGEALTLLRQYMRAEVQLTVVTGCEQALAEEIVRALVGPEPTPLVLGSELQRWAEGLVPRFHCYGPGKLLALDNAGHRGPFDVVYTDSSADLPLLLSSRRAVLVRASARTVARVRRQLAHVELLDRCATSASRIKPRGRGPAVPRKS